MMNETSLYMSEGIDTGSPLLEIGSFCLRAWPGHAWWDSIVTHGCNEREPNWLAPLNGAPHPCPDCGKRVPDAVMGAWILHNYDYIQTRNAMPSKRSK